MKIVHTESSCGWGGQEIRVLTEAAGLMRRGHNVQLLCPAEARIFPEAKRMGIAVTPLPIARKNLRGLLAMRRWLSGHSPDVINTHSSTDSWLTALACLTLSPRPATVRTRHISAQIPDNAGSRWLYTQATDHIVTTGELLREQLIRENRYPEGRITSIPTGIDTHRFQPGDKEQARRALGLDESVQYIGVVATLRSWKGHHHLIEAFTGLNVPDWRLLIVGDGPRRQYLEDFCRTIGAGDRVRLVGHQENAELWLQALDIFCLPSYANEGVPQALMQAMLSGLPVVTTSVGSITEVVDNGVTGIVVSPAQPEQLAAALRQLIDDPRLAASLGQAARNHAIQHFGLEAMLDKMETMFGAVVSRHREKGRR